MGPLISGLADAVADLVTFSAFLFPLAPPPPLYIIQFLYSTLKINHSSEPILISSLCLCLCLCRSFVPEMDLQDAIAMALEFVLETERRRKKQLEHALAEKRRERSMLARKKHRLLRKKAAEQKLFDDFMVFIGAIENNDRQIFQNFDENEMMNAVVAILTGNDDKNGDFSDDNGQRKD
ncbi:uncharacterized protein LOC120154111 [Hibiscus syriacus]|uniref:uncharacterized protein LOC120154111 n=1 Tax=Hibiscus syriacus TaxID=106335 RepID=UPI001920666C|nr:uncharacterized protein LOC120154111 [Hibiscus syriacus]